MLLTDDRPDAGRGRTRAAAPAVPAGLSGGVEKMALILPTLGPCFHAEHGRVEGQIGTMKDR